MSALPSTPFSARLNRSAAAPVAALDIGSARVLALVGLRTPSRTLSLRGVGAQSTRRGEDLDVDPADAFRCARIALDCAERMAGVQVWQAVGVLASPGITSFRVRAHASTAGGVVEENDVRRALAAAAAKGETADYVTLHVATLGYVLDDGALIDDPRGCAASRLSVEACVVVVPRDVAEEVSECARSAGVALSDMVAAPYMAGLAVLTDDERRNGAIVIDLGATTTGVSVFAEDGLVHCATLPLGADLLTEMLSRRIETSFAVAERLKLTQPIYGAPNAEQVLAPHLGRDGRLTERRVARGVLLDGIDPALIEVFRSVAVSLAGAKLPAAAAGWPIAITGGGAELHGLEGRARELLKASVRVARPHRFPELDAGAASGSLAAAAGALRWKCSPPVDSRVARPVMPSHPPKAKNWVPPRAAARAWDWLKANF
jgi:cell division protein FtsA